ncbi:DMT family transporter [Actinoplanes xinjiangensis]|uniref:Small multidrug resistance pump n=1 Tax=Actinoplanes xinjiangensis TaxID=512350 RepID=A0A316ETQ6_9ACTN|nr:multidrug efflux SMR transporter [Actinoplanes xinjiangensis]PWK36024.1 small multidrug resistance pump [Actinoplanes xinjiangensis]GIF42978.1 QacE family quaternary ammonium compound efflux SMR transporter [Actinoplanes xinjiangensis]
MAWILLLGAIAAEVTGTTALKLSNGLSRWGPTVVMGAGYLVSFALLAIAVKQIPISVAYAIWSGVGTAVIAVIGLFAFDEQFSVGKVAGILLVIAGVVVLNLAEAP